MFGRKGEQDRAVRSDAALRCSFCQKSQDGVRKLIAGPSVFICDECVDVCNQIIADDQGAAARARVDTEVSARMGRDITSTPAPEIPVSGNAVRCSLCRMPMLFEHSLAIPNRGLLCQGCIGEIEASVAERRLGS